MGEDTRSARVAIVGGGCAGIIAAAHLLLQPQPVQVTVLEASGVIGQGPAYGTTFDLHELNTVAEEMSALASAPLDFVEWSAAVGAPVEPRSFAPRTQYGRYLGALLGRIADKGHPESTLEVLHAEAVAISARAGDRSPQYSVGLANGAHLVVDDVVLAVGMPTSTPHWVSPSFGSTVIIDPWAPGALDAVHEDDRVLLVGTGLTMVDIAVELSVRHGCRTMYARSRHGLLPLEHHRKVDPVPPPKGTALLGVHPEHSARKVVRSIRQAFAKAESEDRDWQDVVAELRLAAPALWSALPALEQRRILRHALRYWEIHRHRITPASRARIDTLVSNGHLDIRAGRVIDAEPSDGGIHIELRGPHGRETLTVDVIINCTGPGTGFETSNRLIGFLVENDLARVSENGLGLELDSDGAIQLGEGGARIHTIGWLRKGAAFESTGVPEIRAQAAVLVGRLTSQ